MIEDIGTVRRIARASGNFRVTIASNLDTANFELGESVAVNGACFTVVACDQECFVFEASPESLERTTLSQLSSGDQVHLERAMVLGGRLGGHIVQGHVDGIGEVLRRWKEGNATLLEISAPPEVGRFLVSKGSITIDGVSLTVNQVGTVQKTFQVAVIPHTADWTRLVELAPGAQVNLEADIIGKYVHSLLRGYVGGADSDAHNGAAPGGAGAVTMDLLRQHGFLSGSRHSEP